MTQSLSDWIEKNLPSGLQSKVIAQLLARGYGKPDLGGLDALISFSPRLLLNSLYEAIIASSDIVDPKASRENAQYLLHDLILRSDSVEKERDKSPLAHFIWVGPPRSDGAELVGVRSLQHLMNQQKIYLWVLEEFKDLYQKRLEELPFVLVVSIEKYAQKMQLSLPAKSTNPALFETQYVMLVDQIEFFKRRAQETMQSASHLANMQESLDRKVVAIRDRVTIVDYIKTLIPLYEGGWVFDADIMFFPGLFPKSTALNQLPGRTEWLFPEPDLYSDQRRKIKDVWFYYCHRQLDWRREKVTGGAFVESRYVPGDTRKRECHLLRYHQAIEEIESFTNLPQKIKAELYGSAILQLTKYGDDTYSFQRGVLAARQDCLFYELNHLCLKGGYIWAVPQSDFTFYKHMSSSHLVGITPIPYVQTILLLESGGLFKKILHLHAALGLAEHVFSQPVYLESIDTALPPLFLAALLTEEYFSEVLNVVSLEFILSELNKQLTLSCKAANFLIYALTFSPQDGDLFEAQVTGTAFDTHYDDSSQSSYQDSLDGISRVFEYDQLDYEDAVDNLTREYAIFELLGANVLSSEAVQSLLARLFFSLAEKILALPDDLAKEKIVDGVCELIFSKTGLSPDHKFFMFTEVFYLKLKEDDVLLTQLNKHLLNYLAVFEYGSLHIETLENIKSIFKASQSEWRFHMFSQERLPNVLQKHIETSTGKKSAPPLQHD